MAMNHNNNNMLTTVNRANIFYRIPGHKGTRIATFPWEYVSLNQFRDYINAAEGLIDEKYTISHGTRLFSGQNDEPVQIFEHHNNLFDSGRLEDQLVSQVVAPTSSYYLTNNTSVDILFSLKGGKGGFGSLLRAIGAQIEKTTNRDACRDLSGRRLRDVKREQDLRRLLSLQAKLKEEKAKRKRQKLEKLKRIYIDNEISNEDGTNIDHTKVMQLAHKFDDQEYNRRRSEMPSVIDDACQAGLRNLSKRAKLEKESSAASKGKLNESTVSTLDDLMKEARKLLAECNQEMSSPSDLELKSNNDSSQHTNDIGEADAAKTSGASCSPGKGESSDITTTKDKLSHSIVKRPNATYNLWLGVDDLEDDVEEEDEAEPKEECSEKQLQK